MLNLGHCRRIFHRNRFHENKPFYFIRSSTFSFLHWLLSWRSRSTSLSLEVLLCLTRVMWRGWEPCCSIARNFMLFQLGHPDRPKLWTFEPYIIAIRRLSLSLSLSLSLFLTHTHTHTHKHTHTHTALLNTQIQNDAHLGTTAKVTNYSPNNCMNALSIDVWHCK